MSDGTESKIMIAVSAVVLLFIMQPAGGIELDGLQLYPVRDSVLDPGLKRMLDTAPYDGEISVIVQFRDEPIDADLSYAERIGMELVHRFDVLPMATFRGSREQVRKLTGYPGTTYIEFDRELNLFMEESTSTINATVVWNSWVEGLKRSFPSIDGRDVTVAVVDTGIDAGHPDLDFHEKTITNLKSDVPGGPWYELENSDTSYGHGTHCAGTIAGNGDASAGARQGVAPAANLIGLCVGDIGITLTNTLQGLEWVYDNSKGPNPLNIKVVSNSWGGGAEEYNPETAHSKICQKLTFENNVLVVFAMGNAGSDQHEGEELTASPTGLIPSNIGVAASERDGSGIAYFSSRGQKGLNQTYPDIAAPGVKIWSAHARLTQISAISKLRGNPNPYYLAISGTSMATPHVSGLAALMFQAAPSLVVSERYEDYSGDDPESWYSNPYHRIHEVEWIMEQSAVYIPPDGIPLSDTDGDNGVPEPGDMGETEVGWDGRAIDWAQGYGMVDAEKCVGVALTLQYLRDNFQGDWTVKDALDIYGGRGVFHDGVMELDTDTLSAYWSGEFARYAQDGDMPLLVQNQSRLIWVPENATEVEIILEYGLWSLEDRQIGDLTFNIDYGYDGTVEYEHPFFGSRTGGTKRAVIAVDSSVTGMYWAVGIYGRGFKIIRPLLDREFMELRIEYDLGVIMRLSVESQKTVEVNPPSPNSMVSTWGPGPPSENYSGGTISLYGSCYDLDRVSPFEEGPPGEEEEVSPLLWMLIAAVLIAAVVALLYYRRRRSKG